LIFDRLGSGGKVELDSVAAALERVPWHEEGDFIARTLLQQITQYSKFNEMDVVAVLLAALKKHHRALVVGLVD
jgi:hypothetical protein